MNRSMVEAIFVIAATALCILFAGEPDIIDGWAKRANHSECTAAGKPDAKP